MIALRRRVLETCLCYVVDEEGRFLLMFRGKKSGDIHHGKYNAPGGKVEQGESPWDTLHREVLEETGLTVTQARRLGFLAFPGFHTDAQGNPVDESVHVFLVTGWTGTLREDCPEGDLEWVAPDRIPELPLWEGDRVFLPYVIARKRFEGKLTYAQGKLVDHDVMEMP